VTIDLSCESYFFWCGDLAREYPRRITANLGWDVHSCFEGFYKRSQESHQVVRSKFPFLPWASHPTMASVLKAQTKNAEKLHSKERKEKRKRVDDEEEEEDTEGDGDVVMKNATGVAPPVSKKRNKQRVLMLCSRGVTHRMRHLMNDLEALLPHVKKGEFSFLNGLE
jgi:hypothetical protein